MSKPIFSNPFSGFFITLLAIGVFSGFVFSGIFPNEEQNRLMTDWIIENKTVLAFVFPIGLFGGMGLLFYWMGAWD